MSYSNYLFNSRGRRNGWYGIVIFVIIMILLYFLVTSIFRILLFLSPILVLLILIFDYKVLVGFFKRLWRLLKNNTLLGIGATVLSFFAAPFILGFLTFNAYSNWRLKRYGRTRKEDFRTRDDEGYDEFEIVEEEPLDLEDLEKNLRDNEYDDIFEEK